MFRRPKFRFILGDMAYLPNVALFALSTLVVRALIGWGQTAIPIPPELQWAGSLGVGGFVAWWSIRINQTQAAAHKQQIQDQAAAHQAQLLTIITQNGLREERGIAAQEKTADAILKFTATVEKFSTLERVMQVLERRKDDNPPQSSGDRRQSG